MRFGRKSFLALALSLGLGLGAYSAATAAEHGHGSHWTYEGESGPAHWGSLSEDYATCAKGQSQSPIDISGAQDKDVADVEFAYQDSAINILNNGHTIQVNYDKGSSITVDGKEYHLLQFHFHTPSEHTVGSQHFDTEMHLVHKSDDGKLAVVGVLIKRGEDNEAFEDIIENLPEHAGDKDTLEDTVNAEDLLPQDRSSYRYSGSLTTPPCSEDVTWIVMKTPIELSGDQVDALHEILNDNNRPTQPLHKRALISDSAK